MADALNRRCELIIKFLLRTGTATVEEILEVAGSSAPSIGATWLGWKAAG